MQFTSSEAGSGRITAQLGTEERIKREVIPRLVTTLRRRSARPPGNLHAAAARHCVQDSNAGVSFEARISVDHAHLAEHRYLSSAKSYSGNSTRGWNVDDIAAPCQMGHAHDRAAGSEGRRPIIHGKEHDE